MSKVSAAPALPLEPIFDSTPQPFGARPPDPLICDVSARALRQRTVNFAAKRMTDMLYVSGLDRATADRHFRWRPAPPPGNLTTRPAERDPAPLIAAHRGGDITIESDDADRRVSVTWNDPTSGDPIIGMAVARSGYGGILLGDKAALGFAPQPIARQLPDAEQPWPLGAAVETPPPAPPALTDALDGFFANSTGAYGILLRRPIASSASATARLGGRTAQHRAGR